MRRVYSRLFAFGASVMIAEELSLEEAKLLKRKSVDPLNTNEQDKSRQAHYKREHLPPNLFGNR